jgi:hypothetical protein
MYLRSFFVKVGWKRANKGGASVNKGEMRVR